MGRAQMPSSARTGWRVGKVRTARDPPKNPLRRRRRGLHLLEGEDIRCHLTDDRDDPPGLLPAIEADAAVDVVGRDLQAAHPAVLAASPARQAPHARVGPSRLGMRRRTPWNLLRIHRTTPTTTSAIVHATANSTGVGLRRVLPS